MKISCPTSARLFAGALCGSAFLFLPSHAFSDTCDPVVAGGELTFTNTNCWYQVQDLTTPDYNMCQGNGGSAAMNACPGLTLGHNYRVKKVDTSGGGWTPLSPDFPFTPSAASCADPALASGGGIAFTDTNCWYQVQDLTAQNWEFCKGYTGSISCPAFTAGNNYRVNKVYVAGGVWIDDNPPYTFTAPVVSQCADPILTDSGGISFTDTNCWYQVQDITAEDWEFCKGYASAGITCPSFTEGNDYKVNKVYVADGNWTNDNPPYTFTAGPGSAEPTAPTVPTGGFQNYTGPVITFSDDDVEARNRGREEFFYRQTDALEEIEFAHKIPPIGDEPEKIYGTPNPEGTTLDFGIYNGTHNDGELTSSFGDANANSAGNTLRTPYDFVGGSYEDGEAGNFRIKCQWSHFAYDDPIVKHDNKEPGLTHLHMFWGNTAVDYNTELRNRSHPNYITKKGGSTCQGYGINRSSYWMPALMHKDDLAMVPREIVVYYKSNTYTSNGTDGLATNSLGDIETMPQGLQLISGNGNRVASDDGDIAVANRNLNKRHRIWGGVGEEFGRGDQWTASPHVQWVCGLQGLDYRKFNRIPTKQEWLDFCTPQEPVQGAFLYNVSDHGPLNLSATVYFPQCRQPGENPQLHDDIRFRDHVLHTLVESGCPEGQVRMPRLGYRVYWDVSGLLDPDTPELSIDNLRLSSDPADDLFEPVSLTRTDLQNMQRAGQESQDAEVRPGWSWRGGIAGEGLGGMLADTNYSQNYNAAICDDGQRVRGGTLHADWVAGWHDDLQDMWLDNCNRDAVNCSSGQTGTNLLITADDIDYGGHPFTFTDSDGDSHPIANSYLIEVSGSGRTNHPCVAGE